MLIIVESDSSLFHPTKKWRTCNFKARLHLSVAELSVAKITIKLQQLLPSCSVASLHSALICFTEQCEHTLNGTENDALLCYATLKSERVFTRKFN